MIQIDPSLCNGCGLCAWDCPFGTIDIQEGRAVPHPELGCNDCGHCVAICPQNAVAIPSLDMTEVLPYDPEAFSIPPERLLRFIRFRRSVRQFQNRPVEDEKLAKIIEAGRFTQSSSNLQNVRYIVVQEGRQTLKRLVLTALDRRGDEILAAPERETPLMLRYARLWKRMYQEYAEGTEPMDRLLFGAPVVLLVVSPHPLNGGLAAESLELMTNALALGAVFSGFLQRGGTDPAVREFLGLTPEENLAACLVIGYPKVRYLRTVPRKKPQITRL